MKDPVNILICFSKPETGESLGFLATELLKVKDDGSEITLLNLVSQTQFQAIKDVERYKNQLFGGIIEKCEKNNILVRSFIKESETFVSDILETEKEQNIDLVLLGIGGNVLSNALWEKYKSIVKDSESSNSEEIQNQFHSAIDQSLKSVSALLNRNTMDTGIFVDKGFTKIDRIFFPVLDKNDVSALHLLNRFSKNENTKIMVWDAIGILSNGLAPDSQRFFQIIQKKSDNRISLWDTNKKIDSQFIEQQDLILIGYDGWNKLIATSLPWLETLPSTLIIKKGKSEQ